MNIRFITGIACSGKSTAIMESKYDCFVIKMGDIVKRIAEAEHMCITNLCPAPEYLCRYEDSIRAMLMFEIGKFYQQGEGMIIIDGYPRDKEQYYHIKHFLRHNQYLKGEMAILDVDVDVAIDRMIKRKREGDTTARIMAEKRRIDTLAIISGIKPEKNLIFNEIKI